MTLDPAALGIPQDALDRLAELQPGTKGHIFTSDLTVNEFLLVKQAGFTPLGLVLGTSVYHCGFQATRWSKNQEMSVLSQAMYHARELAMNRMEAEADTLGADGIVGVRLVVDRMSVPYLDQATIDFLDTLEASGFTIDNPMAQGSCACGHSFH